MALSTEFMEAVYEMTKRIPKGSVATYGQIAAYIAAPRHARAVGMALKKLPKSRAKEVPWHRVITGSGRVAFRKHIERPNIQEQKLKREGVFLDKTGQTILAVFGWHGPPEAIEARKKKRAVSRPKARKRKSSKKRRGR